MRISHSRSSILFASGSLFLAFFIHHAARAANVVSQVKVKTPAECQQILDLNDTNRADCAYRFGETAKTVSDCNAFPQGPMRSNCIHALAEKKNNLALCMLIPKTEKVYLTVGHFFHGASVREHCIAGIAAQTNKPSLCRRVKDPLDRKFCIITIGIEHKDPSLCKYVSSSDQAECECNVRRVITGIDEDCSPPVSCRQITYVSTAKDRKICFIDLGIQWKNTSYCTYVSPQFHEECECKVQEAITGIKKNCPKP